MEKEAQEQAASRSWRIALVLFPLLLLLATILPPPTPSPTTSSEEPQKITGNSDQRTPALDAPTKAPLSALGLQQSPEPTAIATNGSSEGDRKAAPD
jgi:V8-like Glu-specific endopeptidase